MRVSSSGAEEGEEGLWGGWWWGGGDDAAQTSYDDHAVNDVRAGSHSQASQPPDQRTADQAAPWRSFPSY